MKKISAWQLSVAFAASLTLGVTNLAAASSAASAASSQNQDENQRLVAQANCRRVLTRGNPLNVRSSPNGPITGTLTDGTTVTIEGTASNGWVMISSPQRGMVFERYLVSCDATTTTSQTTTTTQTTTTQTTTTQTQPATTARANCRRVTSRDGVNVRSSPNGPITGTLAGGAEVTIDGSVNNGWVMISAPQKGMIFARYLGMCSGTSAATQTTTTTQTTGTQTQPATTAQTTQPATTGTQTQPATTAQTTQPATTDRGMCRRVNTRGDVLNVRSTPNGPITGTVANGAEVMVEGSVNNGWVMISSPQRGMVFAQYLDSCSGATATNPTGTTATATSGESCRRILSSEAVSVQKEPMSGSESVGTLTNQQRVTIVNRGANGWVPISEPVNGYIPANKLILCPR